MANTPISRPSVGVKRFAVDGALAKLRRTTNPGGPESAPPANYWLGVTGSTGSLPYCRSLSLAASTDIGIPSADPQAPTCDPAPEGC